MYSYKQEKDYITSFPELTSYLHVAPPPENRPTHHLKLWRVYDYETFLYWYYETYKKTCNYVIHKSPNIGEIQLPKFMDKHINFLQIQNYSNPARPYTYVVTQDGRLM